MTTISFSQLIALEKFYNVSKNIQLEDETYRSKIDEILLDINKQMDILNNEIIVTLNDTNKRLILTDDLHTHILKMQYTQVFHTLNLIFSIIKTIYNYINQINEYMNPRVVEAMVGIMHSLNKPHNIYLWKYSYYMHCFRLRLIDFENIIIGKNDDSIMNIDDIESKLLSQTIKEDFRDSVLKLHFLFRNAKSWRSIFKNWDIAQFNPGLEFSINRMNNLFIHMTEDDKTKKRLPNPPIAWNLLIHLTPNFNEYPVNNGMIIQREHIYTRDNPPRGWPADGRPQNPSGFWFDEVDDTVETDKKERLASQQPKAGKRKKGKKSKKSKKNPRKKPKKMYTLRNNFEL